MELILPQQHTHTHIHSHDNPIMVSLCIFYCIGCPPQNRWLKNSMRIGQTCFYRDGYFYFYFFFDFMHAPNTCETELYLTQLSIAISNINSLPRIFYFSIDRDSIENAYGFEKPTRTSNLIFDLKLFVHIVNILVAKKLIATHLRNRMKRVEKKFNEKEFGKLEAQNMIQSSGKERLYWVLMVKKNHRWAKHQLNKTVSRSFTYIETCIKSVEQIFDVI